MELNIEMSALEANIVLEALNLKAASDGMESAASREVSIRLNRELLIAMQKREDAKFPQK